MLLNQKNRHGGDVYSHGAVLDFSSNINPFGMPPAVRRAIEEAAAQCTVYPDPYCRALKKSVAEKEEIPQAHLLFGNGAAELIYAFCAALPKQKPALLVSPAFCEYQTALAAAGIPAEDYFLSAQNGFQLGKEILNRDFSKYGAVFLCTPNNPAGVCIEPSLLYSLAKTGVRIFADLCFLDLTENPARYDIPRLTAAYPNVVVLKSFTKSFSVPGLRLGFAICSDGAFLQSMSEETQCWNVSVPAQAAGCAAVGCEKWLKTAAAEIAEERRRVSEALSAMGVTVFASEANYLLLHSDTDLYSRLLERGILVRSCADYAGLTDGYFRIAVRTRAENDRLLSALREVLP